MKPGDRVGPYEIVRPLGAGGMGEVYLARDTRLERSVAIKVLPQHLSATPEARQRFEREARSASSLNHPHICTIHDIGAQDGADYIVMEHLEGETLAARIAKGALPVDEVLRIAAQLADALDRAHRQGLVHRDLKPGNIMLTKAGAKLLDFGLAKIAGSAAGASPMTVAATMTSPLTVEGTIVGTFQYMAPEQLEGEEATPRSDIFAFGAVLYEMVTGRKAFEGKTQASLVAAILKETPRPLAALEPLSPPALDRLVATCLAKDPDERRQSMHDVLLELRWIVEGGSAAGVPAPAVARRRSRERLAWLCAALAAAAALALGTLLVLAPSAPVARPLYVSLSPPPGHAIVPRTGGVVLSPSGTHVVLVVLDEHGTVSLWLRALDSPTGRMLEGTEGAAFPLWSPDGRSIAFGASGKLLRMPIEGGRPEKICDARNFGGGTWSAEGTILYSDNTSILSVAAAGGAPQGVTQPDASKAEFGHRFPQFLPDGRHFLFFIRSGAAGGNAVAIGSLDGTPPERLMESVSNAIFVPSYLLFWRDDALRAQAFDPQGRRFTGESFPLAPGARFEPDTGFMVASASSTGLLAFAQGEGATTKSRLVLRDRAGKEIQPIGEVANYYAPAFSRSGKRIAVDMSDAMNNGDIWIHDLDRPGATRLTLSPADESDPVWAPDDRRILFYSSGTDRGDVVEAELASPGTTNLVHGGAGGSEPTDWSRDGRFAALSIDSSSEASRDDIWIYSFERDEASAFLATPFTETGGHFSPDGHWLAYTSNQSGRDEIYVKPFPGPGDPRQVSVGGGTGARWRADGRELFYIAPEGTLMSAEAQTENGLELAPPRPLFHANLRWVERAPYDVAPDGKSFVMIEALADEAAQPMALVVGWMKELGSR